MASRFARISSSAKDAARRSSATMQSWQQDQRNKVTYHPKQQISAARLHSLFFSYPIILSRSKLATRALWTAMAARIHTTMDSWMKDHGFQHIYIYKSYQLKSSFTLGGMAGCLGMDFLEGRLPPNATPRKLRHIPGTYHRHPWLRVWGMLQAYVPDTSNRFP